MISRKHLTQNILLGLICAMGGYSSASAMPTGEHGLQNIDSITRAGSVMDIVGSGNSVAKWQDFSVGKGETVNFKGMNNVLNIVDGHRFSTIRGAMNGQGVNVYLVNPSGVMFSAESSVNVGSLNVSTQEVSKDLENEFLKSGTITPDTSKLGFGDVTFVGNINADSIKVEGNNISLASTDLLNAKDVSLSTPKGGFINVLKGQDTSKLDVSGGSVRDDFEAIDSQEKLSNLKSGGHYMLTKDIDIDGKWAGATTDKTEQFINKDHGQWDSKKNDYVYPTETRNIAADLILDGMGHTLSGMTNSGLFKAGTRGVDVELSNLILDGDSFKAEESLKASGKSAILLDDVTGLKADNIISNYKISTNKNSALFGDVTDGILNNIVNNTTYSTAMQNGGNTGNILHYAYNTDFSNIENNGDGFSGAAYYIWGGDLFASGEIRQIASVEKRQFGSAEIRQFESIEKSQS